MADSYNWNPSPIMNQLRRDEGCMAVVYDDATGQPIGPGSVVKGNPTIGIGCKISGTSGLSSEEIEYLAGNRLYTAIASLNKFLPWSATLDDARHGVLAVMTYNMGIITVMEFHRFLSAMKDRDWPNASKEMLDSKWASQVGIRAQRLATQVETGIWQ